jgi:SSS family solute:Na+ symporter
MVPLIAAAGKLIVPLLVIVPGLAAYRVLAHSGLNAAEARNYDQALPLMIHRYYAHGLLGLGMQAILAGPVSGLAGNIAAFSSLWTQEIYRPYIAAARSEKHYILMGRLSMLTGVLLSFGAAFIAMRFRNLMDYIQFLFSLFNAPLLAIFLLGMFTRWATPWGGFWGLLIGISVGVIHNVAARANMLAYGSQMNANLYGAMYAWTATIAAISAISMCTKRKDQAQIEGLVCEWKTLLTRSMATPSVLILALLLVATCIGLNIWLR